LPERGRKKERKCFFGNKEEQGGCKRRHFITVAYIYASTLINVPLGALISCVEERDPAETD
jgi:hypothetical protein